MSNKIVIEFEHYFNDISEYELKNVITVSGYNVSDVSEFQNDINFKFKVVKDFNNACIDTDVMIFTSGDESEQIHINTIDYINYSLIKGLRFYATLN